MTPAISRGEPANRVPYSTLTHALLDAVDRFPEGQFVHAIRHGTLSTISYRDTLQNAKRLALALQRRGLKAGDDLVINLRNSENFIPALWAALLSNLLAVPLVQNASKQFGATRRREIFSFLSSVLSDGYILTDDPDLTDTPDAAASGLKILQFDELNNERQPAEIAMISENQGGAQLAVLTSGTTAQPKLVGLTADAVLARWWAKVPDARDAVTFLSWSPFDHIMGLGLAAPNTARKIHLDAEWFAANPLSWLDVVEQTGTTHATMTNFGMSLIIDALKSQPGRKWDISRVRKIGIGAEQISRPLCRSFLNLLTPFGLPADSIILGYGLTECGPVAGGGAVFSPDLTEEGPVVLDRPTAGHAVRIVDDNGTILAEEAIGLVEVQGPTMTCGYLGDEEGTADLLTDDDWLRTGDLGFLRNGLLTVVGREKDQIVINAKKFSCLEIEKTIASESRFRQVYVAPFRESLIRRSPASGKPVAIFAVAENDEAYELADAAAEIRSIVTSAYHFVPAVVGLIRSEDVPRTPLGKVQRFSLAAMVGDPRFSEQLHVLAGPSNNEVPDTKLIGIEQIVAEIWSRLLKCGPLSDSHADFFALGGDSVLALQMCFAIEERFGLYLSPEDFSEHSRLSDFVNLVSARTKESPGYQDNKLSPENAPSLPEWVGERMSEFLAQWPGRPASEGGFLRRVGTAQAGIPLFWCLQTKEEALQFGRIVGSRRPAYMMRSGYLFLDYNAPAAKAFVTRYVDEIKKVHPKGPYVIGGNCQGAMIALEVARALLAEGRKVQLLAIADTPIVDLFADRPFEEPVALFLPNGSKFNPYRRFRFPNAGLKKLFPAGHKTSVISAGYASIMRGKASERLAESLEEAIAWSAQQLPCDTGHKTAGSYPESIYAGTITGPYSKLTLRPGQQLRIDVAIQNRSPLDWKPFDESGIALGNHWLSRNGEVIIWSDGRTPLTQTIKAGARSRMLIDTIAPHKPGEYLLELDLVEEGVRWFSEKHMFPFHISVAVEDSLAALASDIWKTGGWRRWLRTAWRSLSTRHHR